MQIPKNDQIFMDFFTVLQIQTEGQGRGEDLDGKRNSLIEEEESQKLLEHPVVTKTIIVFLCVLKSQKASCNTTDKMAAAQHLCQLLGQQQSLRPLPVYLPRPQLGLLRAGSSRFLDLSS